MQKRTKLRAWYDVTHSLLPRKSLSLQKAELETDVFYHKKVQVFCPLYYEIEFITLLLTMGILKIYCSATLNVF